MTDYLNPDKLYPDDISRRIDTPPGFDSVRTPVKNQRGGADKTKEFCMMANECVTCGDEMPEGDHVCKGCRTRRANYPHGLNIRVTDAQMAAIERACVQKGLRISEVVRGALDVWMDGLVAHREDELQSDVPDYLNPHRMVGR